MRMICLDVEGVVLPEIWINVARKTGIKALERTTRDEPDYKKLMMYRIDILRENKLTLSDIQDVIETMDPLDGATEFLDGLRSKTQVILLSDTFEQFAKPLMAKLNWPTLFCNSLVIDDSDMIVDFKLRQEDGKKKAVIALQSLNMEVYAAGDSYNDLTMIRQADKGALFHPPIKIIDENPDLPVFREYDEFSDFLLEGI